MQNQPFFIIGHPRSGTTLLRMILCAHSRIYIPDESGFIPFLKVDPQTPLSIFEIKKLVARIGKLNAYWRDLITPEEIKTLYSEPASLPEVLDSLYTHLAKNQGAARWGDKTPLYIQYIPEILSIFPQAFFIHLIRDGRDAALSAREKWGEDNPYMDLYYLLRNWVRNVQTGRQRGKLLGPNQYFEIYYEELVTAPEKIIPQLCTFLEEDFEPAMLDHTHVAREIGPGHAQHVQVLKPLFQGSIGRWKDEFSSFEIKITERVAGECLAEFGYDRCETAPMSIREFLRFRALVAKFRFFDTIRSLLYRTGWLTLNRTMRQSPAESQSKTQ